MSDLRALQRTVVAALQDIKARDIEVLDVTHLTSLFDRVIIASADSHRQVKALSENVQQKAAERGARVYGVEGEEVGEWVLVDLGDIVVHIMQPAARARYKLEELWRQPKPKRARVKAAAAPRRIARSRK